MGGGQSELGCPFQWLPHLAVCSVGDGHCCPVKLPGVSTPTHPPTQGPKPHSVHGAGREWIFGVPHVSEAPGPAGSSGAAQTGGLWHRHPWGGAGPPLPPSLQNEWRAGGIRLKQGLCGPCREGASHRGSGRFQDLQAPQGCLGAQGTGSHKGQGPRYVPMCLGLCMPSWQQVVPGSSGRGGRGYVCRREHDVSV